MRGTKIKWLRVGIITFLGFVILFIIYLLVPHSKTIPLAKGAQARVETASLLRSFRPEASCKIWYTPKSGPTGLIELWQDEFDGPMLLISSTNTNVLLCLYDYDVDMRLFRIDTTTAFRPLPPSSSINRILFTSTWDIKYGLNADWDEVEDYLRNASNSDFRKHHIPTTIRVTSKSKDLDALTKFGNRVQETP